MFFAISHGQNRAILKKGKTDEREDAFNYLTKKLNKYKVGAFGMNNVEPIWGSNFFYHLSKSKIGLNISRGDYQKLYSSDRISSLIGNGLLVFLERKTKLNTMFKDKKEVIFFNNKEDLLKKIIYYLENFKIRKKIASNGCKKYHKKFNNIEVTKYMLAKLGFGNFKIIGFKYYENTDFILPLSK